jgi:hypothetical protein
MLSAKVIPMGRAIGAIVPLMLAYAATLLATGDPPLDYGSWFALTAFVQPLIWLAAGVVGFELDQKRQS